MEIRKKMPIDTRRGYYQSQGNVTEPEIYEVKELNDKLKRLYYNTNWLSNICVKGEISGFGSDKKGNLYFKLKDAESVLSVVMYASDKETGLNFQPKNGDQVKAFGYVSVYVKKGEYQLCANRVVSDGAGEVNARLNELIARLGQMGLFDAEYKKPIPKYPRNIGIVTAGAKAAISDIKKVARERDPYAQLYCYPATVQGRYAAADMSRGIEILDSMNLDLIIVGRGGGSAEDLWAFNEEQLAWAIFNANTPIISATGHEIDNTLADLVADHRESNPSTAVTYALPKVENTVNTLEQRRMYLTSLMTGKLAAYDRSLKGLDRQIRLLSPDNRLKAQNEKLEEYKRRVESAVNGKLVAYNNSLNSLEKHIGLLSPKNRLRAYGEKLDSLSVRIGSGVMDKVSRTEESIDRYSEVLQRSVAKKLELRQNALAIMIERIHGLSPTAKLVNGFGYIEAEGKPLTSAKQVERGQRISVRVHDGRIEAVVENTEIKNV
jgi:exodeoxyribonuclease VII large subunit